MFQIYPTVLLCLMTPKLMLLLYMVDMYGREKVDEMLQKNVTSKLNRIELEDLLHDWKQQVNDNLKRIGQKCWR